MAKSKNNKILAMTLCASVMAGIYASPVFAGNVEVENSASGIEITIGADWNSDQAIYINRLDGQETIEGYFTISGNNIATALKGQSLDVNTVTTNALTIDGNYIDSNVIANWNNAADVSYKTQNINNYTQKGTTAFDGSVIADSFGTTKENGTRGFWVNSDGMMEAAKGAFKVGADGAVTATAGSTIADVKFDEARVDFAGKHFNNVGRISAESFLIGSGGQTALTPHRLKLGAGEGEELNAAQLANINNVIKKDGNVVGTTVQTTSGADLDVVNNRTKNMTTIGSTTLFNNKVAINDVGISIPGTNGNTGIMIGTDGTIYSQNGMTTSGDFGTEQGYTLNTVGSELDNLQTTVGETNANVAGIKRNDGTLAYGEGVTTIEGVLTVDGTDGSVTAGGVTMSNGDVVSKKVLDSGKVVEYSIKTQNIDAGRTGEGYTTFKGALNTDGAIRAAGGAVELRGNWENDASLGLRYTNGEYERLTATQLGNINDVIGEGGVVTAADGSVIGGVGFTSGAMTNVVSINGASVEAVGDGGLSISGVELENGLVNGVNIEDLDKVVAGTSANVAGIERDAADGAPAGQGTTTIEELLKVSGDSINATLGENSFSFNQFGTSFTGSVDLGLGEKVGFTHNNGKYYTLDSLVNDINNLDGRVDKLEDKTHWIEADENGTTITSPDGNTSLKVDNNGVNITGNGNVGGDASVSGNLDVDGSVTVGDNTYIGDGKVNSVEGNFSDKVTVGEGNDITTIDGGTITTGNTTVNGDSVSSVNGNFDNLNSVNGGTIGGVELKDNTVTADKGVFGGNGENQTIINNGGVTVGGDNGTSINHDEVRVGGEEGSYMNDSDVVTGNGVSVNETADRVTNLEQGVSDLSSKVNELDDRIDKVGAMAAAIANLRTMGYDPAAPTEVAVGLGQYRDETGAALGLFHYPNRDFMLSLSVSTSGDEVMGGIGATWKFGRKSPEKVAEIKKAQADADVRRAEEAKLAKAEEMKKAAKEAKIKAQQERHAKLAAERAAQAEAK